MKICYGFFLTLLFLSAFRTVASSQVVINEISCANYGTITDVYGDTPDWIELYNKGNSAVNLTGYYLSDSPNNPDKWKFPAASIGPHQYLLVFASDRDVYDGQHFHTNFKVTQTRQEHFVLSDPSANIIEDRKIVVPNQKDQSWGKSIDGGDSWAIYKTPTPGYSNSSSTPYGQYAPTPNFSLPPGFYFPNASISIVISIPANTVVRYTVNGNEPDMLAPVYTDPVQITQTTVLKAKAFPNDPSQLPGFTHTATYFIDANHTVPVISIAGRDVPDLMDGSYSAPIGSFEFFDANGQFIESAEGDFNKHGNDSWAYPQRGIDYITRDELGYNNVIHHKIFSNKDRNSFQRLILKASANDNYPFENGGAHIRDAYVHTLSQRAGLKLDERTYEPCVLYVNGNYWGVYDIREKVDDPDFTKEYYNQGEKWIDFIKTWGGTWQEYGSWTDWYALRDFINNNDMSVPANYDYVKERFEVQSLIDYMILNTYVVCKDWLNWNTAWWRGRNPDGEAKKWKYALWDEDATFNHYINYTGVPDPSPYADPCNNELITSDFEGHVALVEHLMQNEEFHSLYVNRFADLDNTYFSCDYMISLLDSLVNRIEPEMPQHIQKWGGNMSVWQGNVQAIRDFINTRCSAIDGGIVDCYDVTGPVQVHVKIVPDNSPNKVQVNTIIPFTFPFTGDYFIPVTMNLAALPATDWQFDHWEVANSVFGPDQQTEAIHLSLDSGDTISAFFKPFIPCPAPLSFQIDTSTTSATIHWSSVSNAIAYEVRYRKAGFVDWEVLSNIDTDVSLDGLDFCSAYEVQIRTICGNGLSDYLGFGFNTSCGVGVSDVEGVNGWKVYPNPFGSEISVEMNLESSAEVTVTLQSVDGKNIQEANYNLNAGDNVVQLKPDGVIPAGIYLLRIKTSKGILVQKMMKQ